MASPDVPSWSFLTNHAQALLCIAADPTMRLRDISARMGITERAVHRIVDELVRAGYLSRQRIGRRSHYTLHRDLPLPDQILRAQALDDLLHVLGPLAALSGRDAASPSTPRR